MSSTRKPAAFKMPRSVTVGWKRVAVKVREGLEDFGTYDHDAGVIAIRKRLAGREGVSSP